MLASALHEGVEANARERERSSLGLQIFSLVILPRDVRPEYVFCRLLVGFCFFRIKPLKKEAVSRGAESRRVVIQLEDEPRISHLRSIGRHGAPTKWRNAKHWAVVTQAHIQEEGGFCCCLWSPFSKPRNKRRRQYSRTPQSFSHGLVEPLGGVLVVINGSISGKQFLQLAISRCYKRAPFGFLWEGGFHRSICAAKKRE